VVGIASFLAGYLLAWAAFGVVVYVVLVGAGRLAGGAPDAALWAGAARRGVRDNADGRATRIGAG